jgi:predicted ATPase
MPTFLASMAEVHEKSRRPMDGLSAVSEALAVAEPSGQHYWTAELYRLKGALACEADQKNAEESFRDAIAIARGQQAKSFELRATMSFSRLWASEGKATEAYAALSDVYNWFTEGFETPDLREARSLLEQLGRPTTASSADG